MTDAPLTIADIKGRKTVNAMHVDFSRSDSAWSYGVEGIPRLTKWETSKRGEGTVHMWCVDGKAVVDLQAALDVINGVKPVEAALKPPEPVKWGIRALSIRQPWVWAIFNLGKDVENRDWQDTNPYLAFRGDFLIHASTSKTRDDRLDYEALMTFCAYSHDVPKGMIERIPDFAALERGGIVGAARVVDIVKQHSSRWRSEAAYGLVLDNVRTCPFIACRGQLGFFRPPADVIAKLPRIKKREPEPVNILMAG